MRLVILGGPGAGKGTQAKRLSTTFSIPWISTGELLRAAIASGSELGQQVQTYVAQGELVPDKIMIQFIRDRLMQPDTQVGWLLDGYPRTAFQAEELDFLLDELGQQLDKALWLEVSDAMLTERSLNRGRMDDTLEIINRRIELFREGSLPLVDYYEFRDRLLRIDGNASANQVQQEIAEALQGID